MQPTKSAPPGARPKDVEEINPFSGYLQQAISLADIMSHE